MSDDLAKMFCRIDKDLHEAVKKEATRQRMSKEVYVEHVLSKELGIAIDRDLYQLTRAARSFA
jgi:predicted HicB family RNase H-like nuclease